MFLILLIEDMSSSLKPLTAYLKHTSCSDFANPHFNLTQTSLLATLQHYLYCFLILWYINHGIVCCLLTLSFPPLCVCCACCILPG